MNEENKNGGADTSGLNSQNPFGNATGGICPTCGKCPTCGRAYGQYNYPQPWLPYQVWQGGTWSNGAGPFINC